MKNWIFAGVVMFFVCWIYACDNKNSNDDERFHPEVHFSLDKNWTGEPSGLIYYEGEYHLFYQYNPTQDVFGDISWGHAVSSDLLHWEQLPIAIASDSLGRIYSGSVIADLDNTSGFGSKKTPSLIAFFTYYDPVKAIKETKSEHAIALAYSLDKGRSWIKHPSPVLKNTEEPVFCNPNVSWNNVTNQWLMTVSIGSSIQIYSSTDCLQWTYLSEFGNELHTEGGWGSSNLFPLKVAGGDLTKWVLLVSMNGGPANGSPAIRYFVGDFNGVEFKMTQTQELWVDYGKDNYGGMTFNGMPDNRKVMLGWMNSWDYANQTPTETWRGGMIFPRDLHLVLEGEYYLLTAVPVKEIKTLYGKTDSISKIKFSGDTSIFKNIRFPETPFILKLIFDNTNRSAIWGPRDYGIRFKTKSGKKLSVGYNAEMQYYYIDRSNLTKNVFSESFEQPMGATYTFKGPTTDWYILVDKNSVELFTCGNRITMTSQIYSDDSFDSFELFSDSGNTTLLKVSITELNPVNK